MSLYKFKRNDIFYNQLKTFPQINFFIYTGSVFYNNQMPQVTPTCPSASGVPSGYISLYELNVGRAPGTDLIHSFITKDGTLTTFNTISTQAFNSALYTTEFKFNYPLSSSMSSSYYAKTTTSRTGSINEQWNGVTNALISAGEGSIFDSIKYPLEKYKILSPQFSYSSSIDGTGMTDDTLLTGWDKSKQEMRVIDIPSIFYGSSIKKGSVSLKFLISGTVTQEVSDHLENGVLRTTGSSGEGYDNSIAGVVMYKEGLILITGSWTINGDHTEDYLQDGIARNPKWTYFGCTGSSLVSSSFDLSLSGTNYVPTLTMFAHAPKGHLNYSNNPTFIEYGQGQPQALLAQTGSKIYLQNDKINIKNITKSNLSASKAQASFQKTTYISKVALYDKDRNLIGIAKLATPVRKRENDDFTFKLKLDF